MGAKNVMRLWTEGMKDKARMEMASGDVSYILPYANDTGAINVGDGTYNMDFKWFASSTQSVDFNVGSVLVEFDDVDLKLGDNDILYFGDGTSGDVQVFWNGTYLRASCPAQNSMWNGCPSVLDPNFTATAYVFFDDFTNPPTVSESADAGNNWLLTVVDTDTDSGETWNLADEGPGGQWAIVTNDADNDSMAAQVNGEMFTCAAGKHMWFECRFKVDDADTCDWFIGLAEAVAGENIDAPDDCIGFINADGTANQTIDFVGDKATAQDLNASTVDIADNTFVTVGFYVNGVTSVAGYINGTLVAALALATANIPVQAMSPIVSIRNASAAASTMTIDYIKVIQLR